MAVKLLNPGKQWKLFHLQSTALEADNLGYLEYKNTYQAIGLKLTAKIKKMKSKILKLSTVILLFLVIGAGCQKDEDDHAATGIIGKWDLLQYPETCVSFGDVIIEITQDSVFKSYVDGELAYISTFYMKPGSIAYDTLFFHNPENYFKYVIADLNKQNDTLHITGPFLTYSAMCNYYKRIK